LPGVDMVCYGIDAHCEREIYARSDMDASRRGAVVHSDIHAEPINDRKLTGSKRFMKRF
jgi:hypothetical protein